MRAAAAGFALIPAGCASRVWRHGEQDLGTLAESTGVRATAVSQRLAKLRLDGLVEARRGGGKVYSVRSGHVQRLRLEALGGLSSRSRLPDHD
jgi:DNA-binding transcriptional ArsR family regulator